MQLVAPDWWSVYPRHYVNRTDEHMIVEHPDLLTNCFVLLSCYHSLPVTRSNRLCTLATCVNGGVRRQVSAPSFKRKSADMGFGGAVIWRAMLITYNLYVFPYFEDRSLGANSFN